ncbi:unnamed protein product [Effrenium voratum]|uniref:Cytochrome P450 n=1 Tax=Effrenium voratum TaxID=2562239 RepID=A0AA36J9S4_9DINO|nr:unnamed protein product [Effrenium voratum]CAJ1441174.1 unnamed protein product [Effrenium voratum]
MASPLRRSAAEALRLGFDGAKVLPFSAMPGPKWPVVGALPKFLSYGYSKMFQYYKDLYKEYGVIVNASILNDPIVVVSDPREWRKVFQREGRYPNGIASDVWMGELVNKKHGFPDSALNATGETWQKGRQALQKDIFSVASATSYCEPVTDAAQQVVDGLKVKLAKDEAVDFNGVMVDAVADVFTAAVLGKPLGFSKGLATEEQRRWAKGGMRSIELTATMLFQPHMKIWPEAFQTYREYEELYGTMVRTTKQLVEETIESYKDFSGPEDELPYVVRVARRGELPKDTLAYEVQSIVLAGLDTTYHVLLWNMLNLAQFPHAQEALREEVFRVLGPSAHFTRDKLSEMPYLKALMRETHRFSMPSTLLTYRFLDEDVALCGYNVPAGTRIMMMSEGLQSDPELVEDPEEFRPERFLPEAVQARKSDPLKSLIDHKLLGTPFSFGARMCLGARLADMEIMTLLAKFTASFDFQVAPNQSWEKVSKTMAAPEPTPKVIFRPR